MPVGEPTSPSKETRFFDREVEGEAGVLLLLSSAGIVTDGMRLRRRTEMGSIDACLSEPRIVRGVLGETSGDEGSEFIIASFPRLARRDIGFGGLSTCFSEGSETLRKMWRGL